MPPVIDRCILCFQTVCCNALAVSTTSSLRKPGEALGLGDRVPKRYFDSVVAWKARSQPETLRDRRNSRHIFAGILFERFKTIPITYTTRSTTWAGRGRSPSRSAMARPEPLGCTRKSSENPTKLLNRLSLPSTLFSSVKPKSRGPSRVTDLPLKLQYCRPSYRRSTAL